MLGVVVITHGQFAAGLKQAAQMIAGKQENFEAIGLEEGQSVDDFQDSVWETIKKAKTDEGVLIFVDMFGATPFNTVSMLRDELLSEEIDAQMITGVNLPAILEALTTRGVKSLEDLTSDIHDSASENIETLNITGTE